MTSDSGSVVTTCGRIAPEEIGVTLPHEHTFADLRSRYSEPESAYEQSLAEEPVSLNNLWFVRRNRSQNKDNNRLGSMDDAIDEVRRFRRAGGRSIVDVTPEGLGRDPERVRKVARATGVQYVHGTAFYIQETHPPRLDEMTVDELKVEFVSDVVDGIGDTDVRAGIIGEIGLSVNDGGDIYEREEMVLRAAARAARHTGAALTVHPPGFSRAAQRNRTYPTSRWALDVLDIVEEEGLPPGRVVMGHLDRTFYEDVQYHLELAERGAFLEYDLWGSEFSDDRSRDGLPSDKWRIDATVELIENGHLDRILVSQDVCQKIQLTKYGGFGYAHLLDNVAPLWREHGVTEDQIREMMVENPRRLLTFEDPNPPA